MCQTTVFLLEGGKETLILNDVVSILPEAGRIRMMNLFGEEKIVEGKIKHVDLLTHRIIILAPNGS